MRSKNRIVLLVVNIKPEGNGGDFDVLFKSSDCLLYENKNSRIVLDPRPTFLHSRLYGYG